MTAEPNVTQAVPFFMVHDLEASSLFYTGGLGFVRTHEWVVDGKLRWCWLQLGGAAVMLQEFEQQTVPNDKLGQGVSIYFICRDALSIYRELTSRGVPARRPFVGNGMWVTSVKDPDGYELFFESPTDAPEESEYTD